MNGWLVFVLIVGAFGIIVGDAMALKYMSKMKLPEEVQQAIAKRKAAAALEKDKKKPTDD